VLAIYQSASSRFVLFSSDGQRQLIEGVATAVSIGSRLRGYARPPQNRALHRQMSQKRQTLSQ
jgi:hypothetical protein